MKFSIEGVHDKVNTAVYAVFELPVVELITGCNFTTFINWGYAVAQLVEALRHKPEGRVLSSGWVIYDFSLT